jgi:hypothetical protein
MVRVGAGGSDAADGDHFGVRSVSW